MTPWIRWTSLSGLAAALAVGLGCTPDETGYGDGDDLHGGDGDLAEGSADDDDASGGVGGRGSVVRYAPSSPLGDVAIPVTVVAPGGSFGAGVLGVGLDDGPDAAPLLTADGGFVGTVHAAAGDVVIVTEDDTEVARVTLAAGSGATPASPDLDSDGLDSGESDFGSAVDGALDVSDGVLGVDAPYAAWNETTGASVFVDAGQDASLEAVSGDTVCVAVFEAEQALGSPACRVLP